MSKVAGKAFDFGLFKRVLSFVKPYRIRFFITTFLTVLLAFLGPVKPMMIGATIDDYIVPGNGDGMLNWIMLIVGVLAIESLLQFFQTYSANWLGQAVTIDIRSTLFKHILRFKLRYFDKNPIGTLVTRVISDIETMGNIFSQGILIIIGDILKLAVVVGYMFWKDWQLALFCIISIPFLIIATNIFKNAIKKAFKDVRVQVARLNAFVQEHVTGMSVVQIFNREKVEFERFKAINEEHKVAHVNSIWANAIFFPVVEVLSAASIAFLVWWGVHEMALGRITVGVIFEFILLIHMLFRPIRQLADRFNVLQMGMVGSERVFNLIDTDERIKDEGTYVPEKWRGGITFENMDFSYDGINKVLKNISLDIPSGKTLAFVGATGAGKSSMVNVLSRFYEFDAGDIKIDGVSIRDYPLDYLRSHIGVVLQDVFLFSDTVYNNITLKNPDITEEEVIAAAKVVGAHDFIMNLPDGYHFNVMERGGTLSTGQRQLLAFIRAYVYNPAILILDEATSSVDSDSEQMIQKAIERITKGRTSIVVAHRLSTIQNADLIVVLEKGEIMEQGSHFELLTKDGPYRKLFDLQFDEGEV